MREFVVLVVLLLVVGCGEDVGETAVTPTMGVMGERPLQTSTQTTQPPTLSTTPTNFPTQTLQPTSFPTSTSSPASTPLPPLVWAEDIVYSIVEETIRSSVAWSPTENEFLANNCWNAYPEQVFLLSAPNFEAMEITPISFHCLYFGALTWTLDGQQFLYSGSFPEDHPNHPNNYGYDNSAIWIAAKTGENSQSVNFDEAYGRNLRFTDWIDENTLVYAYYCGGGHQCIVKLNLDNGTRINTTEVHVGDGFLAGKDYVAANNGMLQDFNTTALVIVKKQVHIDVNVGNADFVVCLSAKCGALPCVQSPCLDENSRFEDWLPGTNTMLVVVWPAEEGLISKDYYIDRSVPTKLLLWDVDAETISELVRDGIFGRFSYNGRYLAYHTLSPDPQLHILEMATQEEILSVPSAEPTLHWNGEQFFWSPNSDMLVYQDENENWTFMDVNNGRSTPITLSGGARLSNPQWSFDGSYLSVQVAGEGVAVLHVP